MAVVNKGMVGYEVMCNASCVYSDDAGGCHLHKPGKPVTIVGDGKCRNYEKRTIRVGRKGEKQCRTK